MNITLIEGSPRPAGNTATMAELLARHLQNSGAQVTRFSVAGQYFAPCTGCNVCLKTGACAISSERDQMPQLYAALDRCDALLWVTPVYFAGLPAQLKALIDRFQLFYGRRVKGAKGDGSEFSIKGTLLPEEPGSCQDPLSRRVPFMENSEPSPLAPLTRRPAAAVIIGAGGDPFGAEAATTELRSASQISEFTLADPLVIIGPDAPGEIAEERFAEERVQARLLVEALQERARSRA